MIDTKFWTDAKVRSLSERNKLLFLYLMTNPHSHFCGLYYLPELFIQDEIGFSPCWDDLAGLVRYEPEFRHVWVVNMYRYQGRGESIERAVAKHLASLHPSTLVKKFVETYKFAKVLEKYERMDTLLTGCQQGGGDPDKTKTKTKTNPNGLVFLPPNSPNSPNLNSSSEEIKKYGARSPKSAEAWDAYCVTYQERYGVQPVRNRQVNSLLCRLVEKLGQEAPAVAAFYVTHNKAWYVEHRHPVNLLVKDAEGLRTQWATGVKATRVEATSTARRDEVGEQHKRIMAKLEQRRSHGDT